MLLRYGVSCLLAASAVFSLPTCVPFSGISKPYWPWRSTYDTLYFRDPIPKRSVSFNFDQDKVRGVNIGGWLVLEPWITPSIFQKYNSPISAQGIVDEYTLCQQLGSSAAYGVLKSHWDSWASLSDFQKIKGAGFNTVRIPVGYWAYQKYEGDPYVQGAADYVEAAIGWAQSTGLKVWIDLHGAPGSQNGFDNSGQRMSQDSIGWGKGGTVQHTLNVLSQISNKYAKTEYQDVVVAIELLNEPFGPKLDMNMVKQFYRDGYGQVRANSDTPVAIQDAFMDVSFWNGFLTPSDNGYNMILDHHQYQVFDFDQIQWPNWKHRQMVCEIAKSYTGSDKWLVIGEWSAAQTDCAPALNGYGIGARYDGTIPGSTAAGNCNGKNWIDTWDQSLKDDTRAYIEVQLDVYEQNAHGWIFWNFKTEAAAEWDLFRLLDAGIFPQPLSDRKFGKQCS